MLKQMLGATVAAALATLSLAAPASALPAGGSFVAPLTSYESYVGGETTLVHAARGWHGTASLTGLVPGHTYEYEATVVTRYLDGQATQFSTYPVCQLVATAPTGGCSATGVVLGGMDALTPQSRAVVYSPQAHTSVASGEYSYQARLAPYDHLSDGGHSVLGYDPVSEAWSGAVTVRGLTPGATYTWAVTVPTAWQDNEPVGFAQINLCQFTAGTGGTTGCAVTGADINGLSTLPGSSATDVYGAVTSVASGPLR